MVFGSTRGVVKLKFVKLSSSSCNKWTWKDKKTCGSIAYRSNEETFRGVLLLKIIKLRSISFGNMDFEILKAAMLASKSTMLKGNDVTTEKIPGKMLPRGRNNAKANEWSFCG